MHEGKQIKKPISRLIQQTAERSRQQFLLEDIRKTMKLHKNSHIDNYTFQTKTVVANHTSHNIIQTAKKDYFRTGFKDRSYGVEQEVMGFKVWMKNRTEIFAIIKKGDETLLLITSDIGNEQTGLYTIELVSTPTEISDKTGIKDRKAAAKFAMGLIKNAGNLNSSLPDEKKSGDFYIKVLMLKHFIRSVSDNINLCNQITIGVQNDIAEIESVIGNTIWYKKNTYMMPTQDPRVQFGYNYLMCIIQHYASFFEQNKDFTSSESKNTWGIMPRSKPTETIKGLFDMSQESFKYRSIISAVKYKTEYINNEYFSQAYAAVIENETTLGHLLNESTINGKTSSIFEYRTPDHSFDKYLYSTKIDGIDEFSDQNEENAYCFDYVKAGYFVIKNDDSSDSEDDDSDWS